MKRFVISALAALTAVTAVADRRQQWVDSVYNSLTERQRVAQLVIPHLTISDNASGRSQLKAMVEGEKVGGILLGKSTVAGYAALNDYASSLADVPLMITADAEWGPAMRLTDAPRFPHNLALGAMADTAAMRQYGLETARQLRELGISVSFAPVLDVNSNPRNPVIGYRSFGEDPERVAELGVAYIRGLQQGGVMAVAKHFPGHGDTSTDSHHTLPVVNRSRTELDAIDLYPFQAAIENGVEGMLTGHLFVPALDNSGTPASLSHKITTNLLRHHMGFNGLVFTDALEMKGAKTPDGTNNCVAALAAGADVLLCPASPVRDIDAVMDAMADGRLDKKDIAGKVRRLLAAKYDLGLARNKSRASRRPQVKTADTDRIMERLAAGAITVVRNNNDILPIDADATVALLPIGGKSSSFVAECKAFDPTLTLLSDADAGRAADFDVVLVPVMSSKSADVEALRRVVRVAGSRLVPVFFMNPYRLSSFSNILRELPALILAGDDTASLQKAAARAVMGAAPVSGRAPVNVDGVMELGEGVDINSPVVSLDTPLQPHVPDLRRMAQRIDELVEKGLSTGAFPGCQVMVLKDGETLYETAAGFTDSSRKTKVTPSTLYDVASVTKVAATLMGLMKAYEKNLFRLDDHLSIYIPETKRDAKGDLSFRQLLYHTTGLQPGINVRRFAFTKDDEDDTPRLRGDLFSENRGEGFNIRFSSHMWVNENAADSLVAYIVNQVPVNASRRYRYSCLNFILLTEALRRMTDTSLSQWLENEIYRPMGLKHIMFRPLDRGVSSDAIAATERDNVLGRGLVRGTVHDETAAVAGGEAGNAGLFCNAGDLAALGEMLLDDGEYHGRRILDADVVETFMNSRSPAGNRGLGWDLSGSRWVGHTGFTGTCMWLDPKRDIVVVVLTNRVNPSRENAAFRRLNFRDGILGIVADEYL